jgi:nucleotide-binding universal stress UspA family protein
VPCGKLGKIWIAKLKREGTVNILLALDDSEYSQAATKALSTYVQPRDSHVRILHVVESLSVTYSGAEWGYIMDWQKVIEEQRRQAANLLASAAKTLRDAGYNVTTLVEEGNAKAAIIDTAMKWPADLIVLGSHGHRGLQRFLLGSVSEAVARHAPCSVLVVRTRQG